jgi:hypothetical protein
MKRIVAGTLRPALLVIVAIVGTVAMGTPQDHANSSCPVALTDTAPPVNDGELYGVAPLSASDAWAVGGRSQSPIPPGGRVSSQAVIDHWDGSAWTETLTTPNSILRSVSAASAADIWAAGNNNDNVPLIEHYDGTGWTIVTPPGIPAELNGIYARAENDVWAVGDTFSPPSQAIIEHFDGVSWSVIPSPSFAPDGATLTDVIARSPSDAWAVGSTQAHIGPFHRSALIEHWNGTKWAVVAAPSTNTDTLLTAVAGARDVRPSRFWAVGASTDSAGIQRAYILHWNGRAWRRVAAPNGSSGNNVLTTIATGVRIMWAAGVAQQAGNNAPLVEQLKGTWKTVPVATTPGRYFLGAKLDAAGELWLVGQQTPGSELASPSGEVAMHACPKQAA